MYTFSGLYLKENATEIEGTFRVSGSTKRMRELQQIFETPPKVSYSVSVRNKQVVMLATVWQEA